MAPQPQAPIDFNQLLSALISSKGGSDFSSNTMDPVMQYLNGTYQQKPQFDINQLYERTAPTFMSAASLGPESPHAVAAARIKAGQAPWQLWQDKQLQAQSGMTPEEWKSFVNDLATEQQTVKKAMLDQTMEQDVFQKAGMHGANDQWTDVDPLTGAPKFGGEAFQFAPQQFQDLLGNLPQQEAGDVSRRARIESKYGSPVMETDKDKILKMLYDQSLAELSAKERDDVRGKTTWTKDPLTGEMVKKWSIPESGNIFPQKDRSFQDGKSIDWYKGQKFKWGMLNPLGDVTEGRDVPTAMLEELARRPFSQWFGLKPLIDKLTYEAGITDEEDQTTNAKTKAKQMLDKLGNAGLEDKKASAVGRSDANAINAYMDRKQGSAVNTKRQAADLTAQILNALAEQGSTPLKNDIMKNAMLKRSTRNG